MKKIIALLLMLTLSFALVACGEPEPPVDPEPTPEEIFAAKVNGFASAVAATSPATAHITVKSENADYGELNATFDVTYNTDGSIVIDYSVDRLGAINESFIVTETGRVTCDKDGNYVSGNSFSGTVSAPVAFVINLALFENIRIEGYNLFGKVSAANTEAAIGVAIDADVNVVVTKNAGKITSMVASYVKDNSTVSIDCNFN